MRLFTLAIPLLLGSTLAGCYLPAMYRGDGTVVRKDRPADTKAVIVFEDLTMTEANRRTFEFDAPPPGDWSFAIVAGATASDAIAAARTSVAVDLTDEFGEFVFTHAGRLAGEGGVRQWSHDTDSVPGSIVYHAGALPRKPLRANRTYRLTLRISAAGEAAHAVGASPQIWVRP